MLSSPRTLSLIGLLGCQGGADSASSTDFPDDFVWGSAAAGFQVEMGCPSWDAATCNDVASDWYQWVTTASIIDDDALYVTGEPVESGPGMWELLEEDAALMASDGLRGYRMSIEWSRLFPSGEAEAATSTAELAAIVDATALARYHEHLDALISRGITPLVTVNHYTLPLWVHDGVACHEDLETCTASGWADGERIIPLITLYAAFLADEFGGEVDTWATLNEPFATSLSGYLLPGEDRSAPPGLTLASDAVVSSLRSQIEAHAQMHDALIANDTIDADGDGVAAQVGVVLNMVAITPKTDSAEDAEAVTHMDHLYHRLFLEALTTGQWDEDLDGTFDTTRPELADRLEWIGVNYYNEVTVSAWVPLISEIPVFDFFPEFSWDPYPEGLGAVLDIAAEYSLPIIVTENGTPHVDSGASILDGHIAALREAMDRGADVRGYYYWSWVDNYEWNHGMDLRFGLYELEADTKARLPRDTVERYREIIAAGGL